MRDGIDSKAITKLYMGDCLSVLPGVADSSVDLILTDPPYFKYKGDAWDNQWKRPDHFLAWLDCVIAEFQRILKLSGSLYLFASHKMAANVEVKISERLRVLNHIVWVKPDAAGAEKGARGGLTRSYVPQTERIIFACHENPLGDSLRVAMRSAGLTALELNRRAFRRSTGLISLWLCRRDAHGACEPSCADWIAAMRACGARATESDYMALARPFRPVARFSDAWHFAPVKPYPGKHPCEKPADMLEHIILSSCPPDGVVLDAFMGNGSHGVSAKKLGRSFIGIEKSEDHFRAAQLNIHQDELSHVQ